MKEVYLGYPPPYVRKWIEDQFTEIEFQDGTTGKYRLVGRLEWGWMDQLGISNPVRIKIGNGVTGIENGAFSDCTSLETVTMPNSITSIGKTAFNGCTSLETVTIPDSVTSIGGYAFGDCTSLANVTIPNLVTRIEEGAFNGTPFLAIYPSDLVILGKVLYKEKNTNVTEVTIPDTVVSISPYAFSECTSLTSVTIPNSVTRIGEYAFSECTSLSNVMIPDSVTSIDYSAFGSISTSPTFANQTKEKIRDWFSDGVFGDSWGPVTVTCSDGQVKAEFDENDYTWTIEDL